MKTAKFILVMMVMLALSGLNVAFSQWNTSGNDIYNTNTGNVGIGISSPSTLLHVAKNITEPTITVQNLGGFGGATYSMIDNASGANWKFKATNTGGFKIRDNANGLDVFVIEPNSAASVLYINAAGNVGINTSAPANSALMDISSTDKGFLPPRMTASQRTAISSPATGLLVFQTDASSGYYYYSGTQWNALSSSSNATHYIGESYGGGIVFYVYDGGHHGLITATVDQASNMQWWNGTYRVTGSQGDGVNAGEMNTGCIVSTQMADNMIGSFAAKACADYSVTVDGVTYGDWYLPSKYELYLLYLQKTSIGGFSYGSYWSSTEFNISYAYFTDFNNFLQNIDLKNHNYYFVRAIRAF